MTCNDVVGLVLCKSSEGSRVVLSDSSVEGYFVKHLDQFSVFTAVRHLAVNTSKKTAKASLVQNINMPHLQVRRCFEVSLPAEVHQSRRLTMHQYSASNETVSKVPIVHVPIGS